VTGNRRWLTACAAVLVLLGVLPVAAIVGRGLAFGAGDTWAHLAQTVLPRYVGNTLALVLLVGAGVAIGGTAAGWLVARHRFPGSRVFAWALLLPLAMPSYVMAYAYTDFLQYAGPAQSALRALFGWSRQDYWFPDVRTLPGAAAMFVFTLYPYVFLLARAAFLERPPALVEAARTLGLDRRSAFWRVELPLARPAIAAGIALALMETLADYGTVAYFAVDTFTTGVYRAWFSLGDRTAAAQLASVLLLFVVGAIALERASRGAARTFDSPRGKSATHYVPTPLTGIRAALASTLCAIPIALGFVVPVLILVGLLLGETDVAFTSRYFAWSFNSLRVAAVASVVAVSLATLMIYSHRLAPGVVTRVGTRLLNLGYAVPGTVLAVGVLLPLGAADNAISASLARAHRRSGRIAADGHGGSADLRLSRALLRRGVERNRARLRAHHAGNGRRRPQPGLRRLGNAAPRAPAASHAQRRCGAAARVRRRDEGAAGHPRAAAVQLRHAGDTDVPAGEGRAPGRGGAAFAHDRAGRVDPDRRAGADRLQDTRVKRVTSSPSGRRSSALPPCTCRSLRSAADRS
jgi:iron(III) transport system permease protein